MRKKQLGEYESGFLARIDSLLKRGTINEEEFALANEAARTQKAELESRKAELEEFVSKELNRTDPR